MMSHSWILGLLSQDNRVKKCETENGEKSSPQEQYKGVKNTDDISIAVGGSSEALRNLRSVKTYSQHRAMQKAYLILALVFLPFLPLSLYFFAKFFKSKIKEWVAKPIIFPDNFCKGRLFNPKYGISNHEQKNQVTSTISAARLPAPMVNDGGRGEGVDNFKKSSIGNKVL